MSSPTPVTQLLKESMSLERGGDVAAALERAQQALIQAQTLGDPNTVTDALLRVAGARYRLGQYDAARALAEQVLALVTPNAPARAHALLLLGNCVIETGALGEAEQLFHRAADLGREIGDTFIRFRALTNLAAVVYTVGGKFDLALAADAEAIHLAREHNLREWLFFPLVNTIGTYWLIGQPEPARAMLDELGQLASPGSMAAGFHALTAAFLAQDEGDLQDAAALYAQARSVAEAIGEPGLHCMVRMGLSRYQRALGNAADAYAWANDAVAFAERVECRRMWGRAVIERARAEWLGDNLANAEADLRAAIQDLANRQMAFDLARARPFLATLLHEQKRAEADEAWHAAAKSILDGNYVFLLEQERTLAFPLVAAHLNHPNSELAALANALVTHLERVPPPPLQILALGQFQVRQVNRVISDHTWRRRRAGELFRLLLVSPQRSLSREEIVEALWRDKTPASTPDLFHQATSALRRVLEPELPDKFPSRYLEIEEGRVTLHLPPGSRVDFEEFQQHVEKEHWDDALALYRGELLPDDRYADWAAVPREGLRRLHLRALLVVAHRRNQAGQHREALDLCYRILEIEPWQEDAVLIGMRACLAFNDRAGALRLYRELARALHEELDASPQQELQALYQSLL